MAAGVSRTRLILGVLIAVALFGLGVVALVPDGGGAPGETRAESGLATVTVADLPPEARRTLTLIDDGGPFPYARDGVVFGNRERLLPRKDQGYYREYTVPTPGENDRGARRIVAGNSGERYYTIDHYRSFREVVR